MNESQNTKYGNPSRVSLSANWYYLDFTTDYTLRTERGLYQFLGEALGGMVRVNEL